MSLDKEYSERVIHGGTWDPFKIIKKVLAREVTNEDLNHLAITKKEALAHIEITESFIRNYPRSKDFTTGFWQERTVLCQQYLKFLSEYEKGNDIRDSLRGLQHTANLVFCNQCALAKHHTEGTHAGFTFCKHWQKYFITSSGFCSHGILLAPEEELPQGEVNTPDSEDGFAEIKAFFNSEKIPYYNDTDYADTLRFRAYGTPYSLRQADEGIIFCCEAYPTTKLLINAIDHECRGRDGTFGV